MFGSRRLLVPAAGTPLLLLVAAGVACTASGTRDGSDVPDAHREGEAEPPDIGADDAPGDVGADAPDGNDGPPEDTADSDAVDVTPPPCGVGPVRITPEGRNVSGGWKISDGHLSYNTSEADGMWVVDLRTGEEERICSARGYSEGESCGTGFVHDGRVVWNLVDRVDGAAERRVRTYIRDAIGEAPRLLWDSTEHSGKRVLAWGFNGTYLLWEKSAPNPPVDPLSEIHILNVDTLEDRVMASGTYPWSVVGHADLWGDRFVYQELVDSSQARVMMHQISTGVTTAIGDSPCDHYDPSIWEDRVAWIDSRNEECSGGYWVCENPDVYVRFPGDGGQMVEDEGSIQQHVDIFGDWVVWDDERNDVTPNISDALGPDGRLEVFAHNLATGEARLLTGTMLGTGGNSPQVWDTRAFFEARIDGVTREYAVYMVCLE